jgi:hypothetical protein
MLITSGTANTLVNKPMDMNKAQKNSAKMVNINDVVEPNPRKL